MKCPSCGSEKVNQIPELSTNNGSSNGTVAECSQCNTFWLYYATYGKKVKSKIVFEKMELEVKIDKKTRNNRRSKDN